MTRDEASGINSAANFRVETSPVQSGQTPGRWVVSDHGCAVRGDAQGGFWLEGGDVVLSEMRLRTAAPCDEDGNGTNDTSQFERRPHLTRSLPEGAPTLQVNDQRAFYWLWDGWAHPYPLDVTVNALAGVVAEIGTICTGESAPFGACVLAFSPASYAFSVSEGAPVDYAVDTVAASHYHRWTD